MSMSIPVIKLTPMCTTCAGPTRKSAVVTMADEIVAWGDCRWFVGAYLLLVGFLEGDEAELCLQQHRPCYNCSAQDDQHQRSDAGDEPAVPVKWGAAHLRRGRRARSVAGEAARAGKVSRTCADLPFAAEISRWEEAMHPLQNHDAGNLCHWVRNIKARVRSAPCDADAALLFALSFSPIVHAHYRSPARSFTLGDGFQLFEC